MAQIDDIRRALAKSGEGSSDFDLHPDIALPPDRVLKPAGVLVALETGVDGLNVILTKRSTALKHHPGQIAFPGGKQDPDDRDATAAALREAHEEIGLDPKNVTVLGTLPPHETVTRYLIIPTVGLVTRAFIDRAEAHEVSEIFRVPLAHVADPASYRIEGRRWQGRRREYFSVPYGPYYIWGATARMLRVLADRINP